MSLLLPFMHPPGRMGDIRVFKSMVPAQSDTGNIVQMDSRRRVFEAMNHGRPDRVPVMCQLALGHYFLNSDCPPSEIWFDSGTFAEALIEFQARYGFDGVLVNLPGRPDNWRRLLQSSTKKLSQICHPERSEGSGGGRYEILRCPQNDIGSSEIVSKQGDTEILTWPCGLVTVVGPDDNPQTFGPGKTPLARADYKTVDVADPATYRNAG
ncbi:MAG TPA: hypothetical protein VJJ98_13230, partial [Sedimentisphaerales bacterium]|nr:hypothetical protein [Sedimentisphaerales bacterium]